MSRVEDVLRSTLHDVEKQPHVDPLLLPRIEAHGLRVKRRRSVIAVAASVLGVAAVAGIGAAIASGGLLRSGHAHPAASLSGQPTPAATTAPTAINLTGYPVSTALDPAAVFVLQTGQNGAGSVVQRIDRATNRVTQTSAANALPGDASQIVRGSNNDLWVMTRQGPNESASASGLWLLDAQTLAVRRNISQGIYFYGFTLAGNHLWAGSTHSLYEYDASSGAQLSVRQFPSIAVTPTYSATADVVVVRDVGGAADDFAKALYSLDPATGNQLASRQFPASQATGIGPLVSSGASMYFIQVSDQGDGDLHRVNARTLTDEPMGGAASGAAAIGGSRYTSVYSINGALVLYNDSTGGVTCTSSSAPGVTVPMTSPVITSTIASIASDQAGSYVATADGRVLPAGKLSNCAG